MVKKFVALFVSLIFAFGLGIAYAEEEKVLNPWERDMVTSAKKEDKARKQANKTEKKKAGKANVKKAKKKNTEKVEHASMEKAKKTNTEKVENASMEKAEKKETGQKKKFIFW
jgi:hypothetical protein